PGRGSAQQISYLKELARIRFPGFVTNAVCATAAPFVQSIYDIQITYYHRRRICLLGDAAALARPHASVGAVKAMEDAIALSTALSAHHAVDAALEHWDKEQCSEGNRLVALSRVIGKATVTDVPDWRSMTGKLMEQWFSGLMSGKKWYQVEEVEKLRGS